MWIHKRSLIFNKEDGKGKVIAGKSQKNPASNEVDWSLDVDEDYEITNITTDCDDPVFRESLIKYIKGMRLEDLF